MFAFLTLPLVFTSLLGALAQDAATSAYPDWVSNDYNCVIGCLQGFNSSMTTVPNTALENTSLQCVTNTCNNSTYAGNIYQAQYIISMFYATGSIYEASSSSSSDSSSPTSVSGDSSSSGAVALTTSSTPLAGTSVVSGSSSATSKATTTNSTGNSTSWGSPRVELRGSFTSLLGTTFALAIGVFAATATL